MGAAGARCAAGDQSQVVDWQGDEEEDLLVAHDAGLVPHAAAEDLWCRDLPRLPEVAPRPLTLLSLTVVQPTQVTTPLPANAHDEDLLTGQLVNRPPSQYTVVSKVLVWIQIARCLQSIFEHIDTHASSPSYEFLLRVDERLNAILSNAPAWLKPGGPTEGMPTCVDWVR